ncbi:MAG TPA: 3-dehydroquinate synthase [Gemmatimonadales bacterium]
MTLRVPISEQRDASYDILIGRELIADLPELVARHCPATRYAVISDSHVQPLLGQRVTAAFARAQQEVDTFTVPAGEWNKTRDSWATISDQMLAKKLGRDCAIIALGGGVVGDLAGFVAATYLRGIPYVQVPTSLLAMIDSSIGGKTGVDVRAGKNLLGAFHQPRLVVADLDALVTLPAVQLAAGLAEAVKHGVIGDGEYFAFLEREQHAIAARDPTALERVVTRSVAIKAAVVADDERETGRRAVLNFGHTVAHAIEATCNFELLHGEAVAIGMAYEARLAEHLGLADQDTARRIIHALQQFQLPLDLPAAATADHLIAAMEHDKKARAGTIRFSLPARIGTMHHDSRLGWTVPVPPAAIREVLLRDYTN